MGRVKAYPGRMSTSELRYREDARWPCSLVAVVQTASGVTSAHCLNLSRTGALFKAATRPRVGERLKVRLDDPELPFEALAEVVRHTPTGWAVRFVELTAQLEGLLRHALDSRIAAARERRRRRAGGVAAVP